MKTWMKLMMVACAAAVLSVGAPMASAKDKDTNKVSKTTNKVSKAAVKKGGVRTNKADDKNKDKTTGNDAIIKN